MNQSSDLHGVITAVLTPFGADGRPHLERLRDQIRRLEAQGCAAVLLAGTTGEGPSLSREERKSLVETGVKAAARVKILACTTCASLPETIDLTRHAFAQGVDGVTVMPPFFFKGISDEGLYAFYRHVLDEAVPAGGQLLLYHIPQVTGVPLSFELIARLLSGGDQRITGIKDSAGDLEHCRQLCLRFPQLRVFTGNDQFILEALRAGAQGCVTGVVNVFAPLAVGIYQAYRSGDPAAAALQSEFTRLWSILDRYQPYPMLMKALLALNLGDPDWLRVRNPLVPMQAVELQKLLNELRALALPAEYRWLHDKPAGSLMA